MNVSGAGQAESVLHDARFDLDTVEIDDATFSISGVLDKAYGRWRTGRFRVKLAVHNAVAYSIVDDAGVGGIDMDFIREDHDTIVISGHVPVEIVISVAGPAPIEAWVDDQPFLVRRFGRWGTASVPEELH